MTSRSPMHKNPEAVDTLPQLVGLAAGVPVLRLFYKMVSGRNTLKIMLSYLLRIPQHRYSVGLRYLLIQCTRVLQCAIANVREWTLDHFDFAWRRYWAGVS